MSCEKWKMWYAKWKIRCAELNQTSEMKYIWAARNERWDVQTEIQDVWNEI